MASKFYTLLETMVDRINRSVRSINNILPDQNGEVAIPIVRENLLDNSDFSINQGGSETVNGIGYITDRWKCVYNSSSVGSEPGGDVVITPGEGGDEVYDPDYGDLRELRQYIDASKIDLDKTYTFAYRVWSSVIGNVISLVSGNFKDGASDANGSISLGYDTDNNWYYVSIKTRYPVTWAALYEGEFNADNLPKYRPKDRIADLGECYKYYRVLDYKYPVCSGLSTSEMMFTVDLGDVPMRDEPTVRMLTIPTKAYVGSSEYTIAIDESTVAIRDYVNGSTIFNVYAKSTKTAEYMKMRPTCVDAVKFVFDARP